MLFFKVLKSLTNSVCVCQCVLVALISPDLSLGARNIYHQLLMNSLLMDLKYKKIFAIQFAKVTYLNTPSQIILTLSKMQ